VEVIIAKDAPRACRMAAGALAGLVRRNPRAVLGLPTGSSPRPVYAELVRLHRAEGLDCSGLRSFNLDEFVGVPPEHPGSYHRYMAEQLFDHLNIPPEQIHLPDGMATDLRAACEGYEAAIREAGGIDLMLLGLGEDGHIGFNEPASSLSSRTRLKTLSEATAANQPGFAPGEVPRHVLTMGVGTILEARRCLVLVYGARKAAAVAKMIEGPLSAMVPASALQLHPRVTVLLDEDAAALLSLRDYYRFVHQHKPAWQREDWESDTE
jgi:glucosamine-6-phosphate deaminase